MPVPGIASAPSWQLFSGPWISVVFTAAASAAADEAAAVTSKIPVEMTIAAAHSTTTFSLSFIAIFLALDGSIDCSTIRGDGPLAISPSVAPP